MPSQKGTPDTPFGVASCSKSLTAVVIGLLIEEKNHTDVQYDALVPNLLPDGDFVMASEEHTRQIMVGDILGHRTGMAP